MKRLTQIQLSKPWNKNLVKQLNKGFGNIDYVEHTQVTQKLIALIPDLNIEVGRYLHDTVEDINGVRRRFVTGVEVKMSGTIDGNYVQRQEIGMCDKPFFHADANKVHNNGQRAKEALSDAIKRCAMRLGVGIELYDTDTWLGGYLEKNTVTEEE